MAPPHSKLTLLLSDFEVRDEASLRTAIKALQLDFEITQIRFYSKFAYVTLDTPESCQLLHDKLLQKQATELGQSLQVKFALDRPATSKVVSLTPDVSEFIQPPKATFKPRKHLSQQTRDDSSEDDSSSTESD